jgi:hypothetical protein
MWDDDTPMVVTDEGRTIAPSLTDFMFHGGRPLRCREAGDPDNDGNVDVVDGVHILEYLFLEGPAPSAPGPHDCGEDPDVPGTAGDLGCESYTSC